MEHFKLSRGQFTKAALIIYDRRGAGEILRGSENYS